MAPMTNGTRTNQFRFSKINEHYEHLNINCAEMITFIMMFIRNVYIG